MATKQSFQGWMGLSADASKGKMEWQAFEPKPWEETDVDIAISHCGICGSDLHVLRSGWGATPYPVCVGHEIVGIAIRVGSSVSHIKVGDRVGVGAQSDACLNRPGLVPEVHPIPSEDCFECSQGAPNACPRMVNTYASTHYNGGKGWGGYATHHRAPGAFVVRIPDGIESKDAAPMLCGGVTVYSPLKRHGAGPGKRVGIIGLGGLGHFGILFAKALGADKVVAISRRKSKEADALALGADYYIATAEEENWAAKHRNSLDLIVSTVSSAKMPLTEYLGLLRLDGVLVQVGAPEEGPLPVNAFSLIMGRKSVAGSVIGSPKEIEEMLALAAQKEIHPWVEERKMTEANKAMMDMEKGEARYRYVLVNEKAGVSGVKVTL